LTEERKVVKYRPRHGCVEADGVEYRHEVMDRLTKEWIWAYLVERKRPMKVTNGS